MAAIQFYGKAAVLDAFESRGIETWAIFQSKNLNYAGIGADLLSQVLDKLEGSAVTYTLAVYDGIDNPNQLTNRTENNGAFNFKLDKVAREAVAGVQRFGGAIGGDPIYQEIHAMIANDVKDVMKKRLSGVPEKEEDENESWGDIIKKTISQKPETVIAIIGAVKDLLNGNTANIAPALLGNVLPKIAGTAATVAAPVAETITPDETRLANVLDRLEARDPNILHHLELLANLAENNPAMYNMAIKMLKDQ